MNPYTPARIALSLIGKTLAGDDVAAELVAALAAKIDPLYDEWQRRQTTAIDENGNIVIGLSTLSMSARPLSMR